LLCAVLAYFSVRLVWQSHTFNDISQGNDATPLWIPQLAMAAGAIVLLVAMADDLVALLRRREIGTAPPDELRALE
jgi:TRAP-type C4-dicarboxylate transport system permease small subunit